MWTFEDDDDGIALRVYRSDEEKSDEGDLYLNISEEGLFLGEKDILNILNIEGEYRITKEIDEKVYYVRFTNSYSVNDNATSCFTAGTGTASSLLTIYEPKMEKSEDIEDEHEFIFEKEYDVIPGEKYVIFMNVTPNNYSSSTSVALVSEKPTGGSANLTFRDFKGTKNENIQSILWQIDEFESGYSLKAVTENDEDELYLNINTSTLTLGSRQALNILNDNGDFKITRNISSKDYYVRFTNSYSVSGTATSCFTSGTNTSSSTLTLNKPEYDYKDVYVPSDNTEQLFTIVATSDYHIDYGIQDNAPYIRTCIEYAMDEIKSEINPDLILVGGDITSHNSSAYTWDKEKYDRCINLIYEACKSGSKFGRTLYITGNHDFAAGNENFNSGNYMTEMKKNMGDVDDCLMLKESEFEHTLGFHYNIAGYDFLCMNTAYIASDNHTDYIYEPELIDWIDMKLDQIGNKTVFVLGHYPLRDSRNVTVSKGITNDDDCNEKLKNVFLKYPEAIYLYGHDHGNHIVKYNTFERITPYMTDGSVIHDRKAFFDSFMSAFMGSMSYYSGSVSLTKLNPTIIQCLVINIYSDRIDFEMKNYGESYVGDLSPNLYSVKRDFTTINTGSVAEEAEKGIVKIYPSVTNDYIYLDIKDKKTAVRVVNSVGSVVYSGIAYNKHRIDVSSFTPGVYFVVTDNGIRKEYSKIIITN